MAFSDLCHIGNAYKTVENDTDQSERIMEENSIVRDLITKILDETGPTEGSGSIQPPEKAISSIQSSYPKNDTGNTSYIPPSYNNYQSLYNYTQNNQNGFNFNNMPNGYNTNGFVNYPDNDVNALLGIDPVADATETVTPEQLNLLRLAAQEIGGAQFTSPKFDEKFYNYFEPNQRNSLPESNMFNVNNFSRPNSLNLDTNYANYDFNQRFPYKEQNQDPTEILAYLNQLNISLDRNREDNAINNMDFKMPLDLNYQNDFKMNDENKVFYRNYPNKFENFYEMMQMSERSPMGQNQNYEFPNQQQNSVYKPNGFHQNEFMRRDVNQMMPREGYQPNGMSERNFDNVGRENMQQAALMRQNHELARQMSLLMRNRPPPNQLNVDVSFLHENTPFGLGLGALLAPNPSVPPPVLPSPMLDLPLLAPFYAMRNMRGVATSSSILHARLDACYEQWRQLERERKRTEARLALAYPGRAVSSSNSIPVPRLPPCPTRVDRLTVDMLREHTKVLTLMGKMETLRASVCVAQNRKPNKPEDAKITVLKRGQENVASEKEMGMDPATFDPSTWREDLNNLVDIAPHSEVESAMMSWRGAVCVVQAARRRELAPHRDPRDPRDPRQRQRPDPILQLAEAVRQLGACARRARAAMWSDLTLTVALAQHHADKANTNTNANANANTNTSAKTAAVAETASENVQKSSPQAPKIAATPESDTSSSSQNLKQSTDAKEDKPQTDTKLEPKPDTNKSTNKQTDKDKNRRTQYRKVNGRNDFYQKNQRYDNRFMHRHPYHYLATGPIN